MNSLSAPERNKNLELSSQADYDLIIIGGGITGAGIALDASSRGLRVALFDKQDFGEGTSSRSTKLIHGGLRYLQQFRFREVASVGRERKILFSNAPHLVFPEKMLLPIYSGGELGMLSSAIGLWIYDLLAGVNKKEKRKMLGEFQSMAVEPLLRTKGLLGSGLYYEYRTDDNRLVMDVIKKAVSYSAVCFNHCKVTAILKDKDQLTGVAVKDIQSGVDRVFKGTTIVNAGGPWVDEILSLNEPHRKKILHHTKGVHIVVSKSDFPLNQSVYFDAPKRRMIFAIPRGNRVYIGTTDTDYASNLEHPRATKADVEYLLACTNNMFPSVSLSASNILSSWAGIRPLVQQEGKSPSEISRKDEIIYSPNGLISMAGGKLTGYRKMAEKVVDEVIRRISAKNNKARVSCQTKTLPLATDLQFYSLPTLAKVEYSIRHESCLNLRDFFLRRTSIGFFEPERIEEYMHPVAECMQKELGWDTSKKEFEKNALMQEIKENITFRET